jgi:GNAT superfamily N-acetyltransferase
MGIIAWFLKLKRNLNDYSFSTTVMKGLYFLLSPLYETRTYRVYCIDLSQADKVPPRKADPHFVFKTIVPENGRAIAQIESMAEWMRGQLKRKLEAGHLCMVVFDGEKVVGFNIVCLELAHLPLVKMTTRLAEDEAWSEQITVEKSYRRKGLASELRYYVFEELRNRGIKKFCGAALVSNEASLKLARSVGFSVTEDIRYTKLFGYKQWRHLEVRI